MGDYIPGRSFGVVMRLCNLVVFSQLSQTLNYSIFITDDVMTRVTMSPVRGEGEHVVWHSPRLHVSHAVGSKELGCVHQ